MEVYDDSTHNLRNIILTGTAVCIQFSASWCGPCKRITPEIKKLATKNPYVRFIYVDVDKWDDIAGEKGFQITQLPTFLFYKYGKEECDRVTGANLKAVEQAISKLL